MGTLFRFFLDKHQKFTIGILTVADSNHITTLFYFYQTTKHHDEYVY